MSKPKPTEIMARYELLLPASEKEEWKVHAKTIGVSLAQMIRTVVNRAVRRDVTESNSQSNMSNRISELEENLRTMMVEYLTNMQSPDAECSPSLDTQILALLEDFGELSRNQLKRYTGAESKVLNNTLAQMSTVELNPKSRKWRLV